jgi:hypothetical protein
MTGAVRSKTFPYDPRYERGRSVGDAKARYLHQEGYSLDNLEADLERLLRAGGAP